METQTNSARAYLEATYNGVEFVPRNAERYDFKTRKVSFRAENVMFPSTWDQNAIDVTAEKYMRRRGVPSESVRVHEEGVPVWLQRSTPSPEAVFDGEVDSRQTFHRMAGCWTYWGWKGGYFDSETEALNFYAATLDDLAKQQASPNSPQWFNNGLNWAYGLEGKPEGHWYVDNNGEPQQTSSRYGRVSAQACFILGMKDDLLGVGGIMDTLAQETRIFKSGSGSGLNASPLRAIGEPLSSGGSSSGMMSFLKVYDANAGSVKSGGTTRRAACMRCVNVDHPEIEAFIEWKVTEENKVAALVAGSRAIANAVRKIFAILDAPTPFANQDDKYLPASNQALREAMREAKRSGIPLESIAQMIELKRQHVGNIEVKEYDTSWTSEAYETVSGQNSNNSVRVSNEFMKAVAGNRDWNLTARTDGKIMRTIKAGDLWDRIAVAAWRCADPGLHYETTINEWSTCANDGPITASNPCSEFLSQDNTACNLASINLVKMIGEDGIFDTEKFTETVERWTRVLDITVNMCHLPSKAVAIGTYNYRDIGLGFANLGAFIMRMGYAYDSEEGRGLASAITALMTGVACRTSAEMARKISAFPRFEANREHVLRVIKNHRSAVQGNTGPIFYEKLSVIPPIYLGNDDAMCIRRVASENWDRALEIATEHGVRNSQLSLIAPTGTIGIQMSCDTTGPEPDFALVKYKSLAGGGNMKIVNVSVRPALKELGYAEETIERIEAYLRGVPTFTEEERKRMSISGIAKETIEAMARDLKNAYNVEGTAGMHGVDLKSVGFTDSEISAMNVRTCGHMTVEGSPDIREEHLPIFDCATPGGTLGKRFIAPEGHVTMLAAIQPFVSGAISKTVNLPSSASIADIKNVYDLGYKLGLKAVALYRDGSKLSQPLTGALAELGDESGEEPAFPTTSVAGAVALAEKMLRGRKQSMPNRRSGYTQAFKIGGHKLFMTTGENSDGTLGEIFLNTSKEGAAFRALMNNFAVAVSVGLQYGVPLNEYIDKFVNTRFEPNGVVQGHEHIKMATSLLDAIFRDLAISYEDDWALANNRPDDLSPTEMSQAKVIPSMHVTNSHVSRELKDDSETRNHQETRSSEKEQAKKKGYTGDMCGSCGSSKVKNNGKCTVCEDCGSSNGCS